MNELSAQIGFDLSIFEVDQEKQMVNLTKIADHFGKEVRVWKQRPSTKIFLEAFFLKNPLAQNMITVQGGNNQGTWASRKLALKFAEWISVDFEIFANEVIDELFQKGKVELVKTKNELVLPANYIEALEALISSEKEKEVLRLESVQKDVHIHNLANDVQETRETLAKHYKTVDARNKADLGKAINDLVLKYYKTDANGFQDAHHASWDAYYESTGTRYFGATKAAYEQKLSFLTFLTSL